MGLKKVKAREPDFTPLANAIVAALNAKDSAQHIPQQPQHKICPKCGWVVMVYETGRSLCTRVSCDYEGPGILRADVR